MTSGVEVGIAIAGLVVAVLAQTGALFYWGGKVGQMLKDHDRRLTSLERREQR